MCNDYRPIIKMRLELQGPPHPLEKSGTVSGVKGNVFQLYITIHIVHRGNMTPLCPCTVMAMVRFLSLKTQEKGTL